MFAFITLLAVVCVTPSQPADDKFGCQLVSNVEDVQPGTTGTDGREWSHVRGC